MSARSALRRIGVGRFRERSVALSDRLRQAEDRLAKAELARRGAELQLISLKQAPDSNWRMLGDERNGARCYAAEVVNTTLAKSGEHGSGLGKYPAREWKRPVLVVLWANGRAEARQRLESAFQHYDGFSIGTMREFNGERERQSSDF